MAFVRQHPDYPKFRKKFGVMPEFSGASVADQESPSGVRDGINKVFITAFNPIVRSETLFKNGMLMSRASSIDLTDGDYFMDYSMGAITFSDEHIPQPNSVIRVSYKYVKMS